MIKSGLWLSRPFILQFKSELSLLIDFEVLKIESYFDLKRCDTRLDLKLVIQFFFSVNRIKIF